MCEFLQEELRLVLVRDRAVRRDHAALTARLEDRWLILDNRRSELLADSDASSFTPLFAINHRGVQLFAAPHAKLPLLVGERSTLTWRQRESTGKDEAVLAAVLMVDFLGVFSRDFSG
jgi:hypothetical protein